MTVSSRSSASGYLYDLFQRARRTHPGRPALEADGVEWSYAELGSAVDRIRAMLLAQDATPGSVVRGVGLTGAACYAAVLAVSSLNFCWAWSSDASSARDRSAGLALYPAESDVELVMLENTSAADRIAGRQIGTAYLITTSGSTARPKTVSISDRNLRSYGEYVTAARGLTSRDRIAQTYQPSFDPFFEVLILAWHAGATVVVPSVREHLAIATFANERGITVWDSVPSALRLAMRMSELPPGSLPDVHTCILGGEALSPGVLDHWRAASPHSTVVNSYGPSEVTIAATEYVLPPGTGAPAVDGSVPIGKVLPHLEGHLDPLDGRPEEFELLIRGPQRFDGYDEPAQNRAAFFEPSALSLSRDRRDGPYIPSSEAWYRTGDIVARSSHGLLFKGRLNRERKVLGARLDLTEVEAVFARDPRVSAAHAVAVGDVLRMYVEGEPGRDGPVDTADLLPHARPREVIWKSTFPLTSSGKVDVAGLEGSDATSA